MFKIIAIGNLGQDPKAMHTGAFSFVKFPVALSDKKTQETTWLQVIAFGSCGEYALKYLKKGARIYLEGRGKLNKWNDGTQDKVSLELVATELKNLSFEKRTEEYGREELA